MYRATSKIATRFFCLWTRMVSLRGSVSHAQWQRRWDNIDHKFLPDEG